MPTEAEKELLYAIFGVAFLLIISVGIMGTFLCCKKKKKTYLLMKPNKITNQDIKLLANNYEINLMKNDIFEDKSAEFFAPEISTDNWKDLASKDFTIAEMNQDHMKLLLCKNINANLFPTHQKTSDSAFIIIKANNIFLKNDNIRIIEKALRPTLTTTNFDKNLSPIIVNQNQNLSNSCHKLDPMSSRMSPELVEAEKILMIDSWMRSYIEKYHNKEFEDLINSHKTTSCLFYKFDGDNSGPCCEAVSSYIQAKYKSIDMKKVMFRNTLLDLSEKAAKKMPSDMNYVLFENFDGSFTVVAHNTMMDKVISELKLIDNNKFESPEKKKKETKKHEFEFKITSSDSNKASYIIPVPIIPPPSIDIKKSTATQQNEYTFPNGLIVKIVCGNLIKENVDAIVNPANNKLQHHGGAAKAISTAAGSDLIKESNWYISQHGPLSTGEAVVTTAGLLKPNIRFVIHVAGPRKSDSNSNKLLRKAVMNALKIAKKEKSTDCDSALIPLHCVHG